MKTKTKTFYYISEGNSPFDMWSNSSTAMQFQSDSARTLAKTNPELLAGMPFAKGEDGDWDRKRAGEILFETPEDAAAAYVDSVLDTPANREKSDVERKWIRKTVIDRLASSETFLYHVCSIELPVEGPAPRVKKFDWPCCANCAFDYYSEDDGCELHSCPFNSKACGSADMRCEWHQPSLNAVTSVPVRIPLLRRETQDAVK